MTRGAARPAAESPPGLLHNMSTRPTVPVNHQGRMACRVVLIQAGIPLWLDTDDATVEEVRAEWLRGLLLAAGPDADDRLRERLDRAVAESGLPAVAPVLTCRTSADDVSAGARAPGSASGDPIANDGPLPGITDRLDVVLGVIAKSSPKVFLASRTPMLSRLVPYRRLLLLLPRDWRLP